MKVCIVISNFYPKISELLKVGASLKLLKDKHNYKIIYVPGTFEIPVVISNLINKYDAFIALGCVIKGKTPHYHYLCSSVINALTDLSIKSKKPIGNGILTCDNMKQAIERAHLSKKNKGGDAAAAVLSVLSIIKYESKWSLTKS